MEGLLANQLRRQHGDVVAGGGYEDGGFAFLHPGKKRRQQARRDSGVGGGGIGAASGEDFFQLVDPQDAGGAALGYPEYFLDVLFRLAYEFLIDGGGFEFHQREIHLSGYSPGANALAATM